MFKIPLFGLSSVFYTSCTKKEPYLFIGKTHKFKNLLNLMTLAFSDNYVLLVSKQKDNYRFMTNSKDIFLQLKERHPVRGGGKNDFFQGTLDIVNEQLFD